MRIAIVGTGISGMTAAWLLHSQHDITVFEANDYVGGHTHTVPVTLGERSYAVDTGFIVYNDWTYPNFIRLMETLGVASRPTEMSFSVTCEQSGIEYAGTSLSTLFAQRRNLLNPTHWRMLYDIARFFREAKSGLASESLQGSLGELLAIGGYGAAFRDRYLAPMLAAIWSADPEDVLDFPAHTFLAFFNNHGLLNYYHRPQWRVIQGGSSAYIEKITAPYADRIRISCPVTAIRRDEDGVTLYSNSHEEERFDQVVLALHSDQALALLQDPSDAEREILGAIPYQRNDVVLHTDDSLLPRSRRAWASWNYRIPDDEAQQRATLTYNMNLLQGIEAPETFCVTLNQRERIRPESILGAFVYDHPCYSEAAVKAQQRHGEISGIQHGIHYCGAYWGYGFHEDGVNSALRVGKAFGREWG